MAELKAVFFDMNGTLWDSRGCARQAMDIILPQFTPPLPEGQGGEVVRRFNALFFDLPGIGHLRQKRHFLTQRRFEALLESYGVRKEGLARTMSHRYDGTRRLVMRQFVRPEAKPVLERLRRRGLKLGAVLNGPPAVQRHLVQSLGLEALLDHVVLGEVEGYSKPDVRLFRRALELAGIEPEQMLFVGDSPLTDVLGAARAGIPVAWFNTGERRLPRGFPVPNYTITSLSEVLDIA